MLCFEEALLDSTPSQLRFLFVLLTLQGFSTIEIYEQYIEQLKADLNNENELMQHSDDHFTRENKSMEDYGLPKPQQTTTLLDKYRQSINVQLNDLHNREPNAEEMEVAYAGITNAINNRNKFAPAKYFVIDAMGGAGKTIFAKKIYHYCHTKSKIISGSAATGLATQVYSDLDFETTHTQFSVPVIEDEEEYDIIDDIECNTRKNTDK